MEEIKNSVTLAKKIAGKEEKFSGYTLEEIKYQRALTAMQADFCKAKIMKTLSNLQKVNPLSPTSAASSISGKAGAVALKLLNGLNYLDYAILGFSVFTSLRKFLSFFKKKKKSFSGD